MPAVAGLLRAPPRVVNLRLPRFARDLAANGVAVVDVEWRPPAGGDPEANALLARLAAREAEIAAANEEALRRLLAAEPVLVAVRQAVELVPELDDRLLLHAGPP